MFRSSTIIRELALNLPKFIFTLKHSVKLRPQLLCGCVAACHGMACVFYAVQNVTHIHGMACVIYAVQNVTHIHGVACALYAVQKASRILHNIKKNTTHDILPHNGIINNDVISPNVLT